MKFEAGIYDEIVGIETRDNGNGRWKRGGKIRELREVCVIDSMVFKQKISCSSHFFFS